MEKDLDKKLYNDYLNGEKQAFEFLYDKYKSKITYFIYNIVKDYQKSEDLTQETFIYIMQSKMKEDVSFKYYIYLVAKSKAFNYINKEKRRNEIIDEYLSNDEQIEKDVIDLVINKETKKDLLDSINLLDEKYKNAIYLVNIENLSYQEVAEILGETLQNTKSLVHRGKKQLRKILLRKGFDEMNKISKIFITIICVTTIMTGIVYAGVTIYNEFIKKQENIETRGLFDLGDGHTYYDIDLMANDMTWNDNCRLYHKIITNPDKYQEYKSRITEFPEVSEIDFDKDFVIVIANENLRSAHEKDMEIHDIIADENTTNIIMKQKENPNLNNEGNVWYAIVDKSLLRENAKVKIEQKEIQVIDYKSFDELSDDYSKQDAINDGCIVLVNNKIVSNNILKLDEFIKRTNNKEKQTIRIFKEISDQYNYNCRIQDIIYEGGIYYVKEYSITEKNEYGLKSYTNIEKNEKGNIIQYALTLDNGTGDSLNYTSSNYMPILRIDK